MQFAVLPREPAFDFRSAFQFASPYQYGRVRSVDEEESLESRDRLQVTWYQKLIRSILLGTSYSAVALTFPVSLWFCIQVPTALFSGHWLSRSVSYQRVKALERCVIFRLGQRLPLQGPGYVLTLPCFDVVDIIDLSPQTFLVTDDEKPILTSDGSIVQLKSFLVTISVSDAVKSFTQIQDSKSNIQKYVRLAFQNVVTGSHVEDLERKIDWIVKSFVLTCSQNIQKWGWEITGDSM